MNHFVLSPSQMHARYCKPKHQFWDLLQVTKNEETLCKQTGKPNTISAKYMYYLYCTSELNLSWITRKIQYLQQGKHNFQPRCFRKCLRSGFTIFTGLLFHSECNTGKAKDLVLVVLLSDRWDMLPEYDAGSV